MPEALLNKVCRVEFEITTECCLEIIAAIRCRAIVHIKVTEPLRFFTNDSELNFTALDMGHVLDALYDFLNRAKNDGALLMERVLEPGTAVIMTLEANLMTKHGVPAVAEAGSSGSIVFRTITDRVPWTKLEKEVAKFYADKKRKAGDKKRKAGD